MVTAVRFIREKQNMLFDVEVSGVTLGSVDT